MALICTCGTELPDNARFCYHCGKPQREEDLAAGPEGGREGVPEVPEQPTAAAAPAAAIRLPINFGNAAATRIGLLLASVSALLNVVPYLHYGCCLWWFAAGFLAAVMYARRTGQILSVGDGARLGWITGLLTFVIWIVLGAVNVVLAGGGGDFREELKRQWTARMGAQDAATQQVLNFMTSPLGITVLLLTSLVIGFLVTASVTMAGGAVGAKVMEKE